MKFIRVMLVVSLIGGGLWWYRQRPTVTFEGYTIAVVQTASHPALDTARLAFKETLVKKFGSQPIRFVEFNVQGSLGQAHMIAQQLHARADIDMIAALGTLAAQAMITPEQDKLCCIIAVTYPDDAGIAGYQRLCGSSDLVPVEHIVNLVAQQVPHARTVAIIYNSSERNAHTMAHALQKHCMQKGYAAVLCGASSEAELPAVVQCACHYDVLVAPIDNMVAMTVSFIAQQALEAKKPFIVSDVSLVDKGAYAGVGVNYAEVGTGAAHRAYAWITGDHDGTPAIIYPASSHSVINKTIEAQLGMSPVQGVV